MLHSLPFPNGSVSSHTAESLTLRNSSPTLPPDIKKVDEFPTLPSYVSKSKNAKFHKLFKTVPLHEYPIDTYSCAFKGDILLQGMMYVSHNWICFYSKIRARGRLLELPLEKVISITREKTALIIPNAIGIQMADTKYVFGSFMSRDNTYKLLITLLKHSQDSMRKANKRGEKNHSLTDSTSPKENEPLCSGTRTSQAGRRALSTPSSCEVTHSADITPESDTTEDDDDDHVDNNISGGSRRRERAGRLVAEAPLSSSCQSSSSYASQGGEGMADLASDKVPGFFSWKCVDYRKVASAFSSFTVKLQKVPRTNLLLVVCSVMVVFLALSSAGLTYKILLLQTQLEMSPLWSAARHPFVREDGWAHGDSQHATLHHLHDVLKANIQVLEQVHQSLKTLQTCTATTTNPTPTKDCPPDQ